MEVHILVISNSSQIFWLEWWKQFVFLFVIANNTKIVQMIWIMQRNTFKMTSSRVSIISIKPELFKDVRSIMLIRGTLIIFWALATLQWFIVTFNVYYRDSSIPIIHPLPLWNAGIINLMLCDHRRKWTNRRRSSKITDEDMTYEYCEIEDTVGLAIPAYAKYCMII